MPQEIAEIRLRGTVQGVGMRPCVWQLAEAMGLCGEVHNDGDGLLIRLFPADAADSFRRRLEQSLPPLAEIDDIDIRLMTCNQAPTAFRIEHSVEGRNRTRILPDIASCPACLAEVRDPGDRRYRYAFANCTHCGPRYSIIRRMPYDREQTAMADFALCAACRTEYEDPRDRRLHAQPIACAACGPRAWLADRDGRELGDGDAIDGAARRLLTGELLAIKALGGFHLACDALDPTAIARLRRFKGRPDKPLAVLLRDLEQLQYYCQPADAEIELLQSPAAPIVLMAARPGRWPDNLFPGLDLVGVMLPSTPLQHLLMAAADRPLVMTSGNVEGAPPCLGNDEALQRLGPGVDALLLHDREILHRVDDSLARVIDGEPRLLRRARGYAPAEFALPAGLATADGVLALGGDLKNVPCLVRQGRAALAPHLGDLDQPQILQQLQDSCDQLVSLLDCVPRLIVCDPHPGYFSRRLAQTLAQHHQVPLIEVQHHHAHLAACLAEHRYPVEAPPVLGLILDGSGQAPADSPHPLWGGEILLADYRRYRRLDGLPAVALPGGEQAAREPWRNLLAHLDRWAPGWEQLDSPALNSLQQRPLVTLRAMIAQRLNAPPASSCGRLFDAVAALLGIAPERLSFEGQAALRLESLAGRADPLQVPPLQPVPGPLTLDRLWARLLQGLAQTTPATLALSFHLWLAELLGERLIALARQQHVDTLALGGGCLQNALLQSALRTRLEHAGFRVLIPRQLPAGDGGLALGQALTGWLQREADHG